MNKKSFVLFLTLIFPRLLQSVNTEPVIINSPGLFSLAGSMEFALTSSGQACVVVNSDNVMIEMNGFSINQVAGFEQPDVVGIQINPGINNITINNGVITDMTSYGIQIQAPNDSIYLTNLVINAVENAGVIADGNASDPITNLFLDNVTSESIMNFSGDPAYGILLKNVDSATITNESLVHNIQTSSGNCVGIQLENCNAIIINDLVANDNVGGGLLTAGIYLLNSKDCIIQNSFSLNNSNTSSNPNSLMVGFGFDSSNNIACDSCISVDNAGTFSTCGFYTNNGNGIQYISCQGNGNNSSALDGLGFSASNGLLIELHTCIAKGNGGANNGYGVFFNSLDFSAIENCDIRGNTGLTNTSFGIDLNNTTTSNITNNTIGYNVGGPITFGLFDNAGAATTNNIVSNIAIKNGTNYSPGATVIPIYVGTLATFNTSSPFTFQNVSIP